MYVWLVIVRFMMIGIMIWNVRLNSNVAIAIRKMNRDTIDVIVVKWSRVMSGDAE